MATSKKYTYSIGRRKGATAIVRLFAGKGETTINDLPAEKYFPGVVNTHFWQRPFVLTDTLGKFYFTAKIKGSGKQSQVEALSLALARALQKLDREKNRTVLKKAGLLTVDARARERRKAGQMGRARKKKQSPKR